MQTITIQPIRLGSSGEEIDVLAHVNSVVSDIETAQMKARIIVRATAADGVRIMSGDEMVWHWLTKDT